MRLRLLPWLLPLVLLSGCDQLGIATPASTAAKKDAEAKAIGAACRHAGRAIEDCYTLNKKADKAAVYTGWREMNDYMRENQIEPVAPQIKPEPPPAPPSAPPPKPAASEPSEDEEEEADAPSDKAGKDGKSSQGGKADKAAKH